MAIDLNSFLTYGHMPKNNNLLSIQLLSQQNALTVIPLRTHTKLLYTCIRNKSHSSTVDNTLTNAHT